MGFTCRYFVNTGKVERTTQETSALDSGPPRSSRVRLVQVFLPFIDSLSLYSPMMRLRAYASLNHSDASSTSPSPSTSLRPKTYGQSLRPKSSQESVFASIAVAVVSKGLFVQFFAARRFSLRTIGAKTKYITKLKPVAYHDGYSTSKFAAARPIGANHQNANAVARNS